MTKRQQLINYGAEYEWMNEYDSYREALIPAKRVNRYRPFEVRDSDYDPLDDEDEKQFA